MKERYCIDLANFERFPSRLVKVGDVAVGGENPIRLQSMTNTSTMDLKSTVEQSKRIFDAGADFVRITTPGKKEAQFLEKIKKKLHSDGYKNPLIADVHFNPDAAEIAAEIVEKVRINPGNYVDPRAKFENEEISDDEYNLEMERMHERLLPLIQICKKNGTAIRIGSNYGSLSDRIMNKYGNTPEGMVEAAMEFYRIFISENFHQLILSMKASDTRVMVEASKLLNAKMISEGISFPQHLGVTEAGEGKEGRLRSAVGIGALLADGIGDTIRVSLTEAPEKEIPVARKFVEHFSKKSSGVVRMPIHFPVFDTFEEIDKSKYPEIFEKTLVVADLRKENSIDDKICEDLNFIYDKKEKTWKRSKISPDAIIVKEKNFPEKDIECEIISEGKPRTSCKKHKQLIKSEKHPMLKKNSVMETKFDDIDERILSEIVQEKSPWFILETDSDHPTGEYRSFLSRLSGGIKVSPVLLKINQKESFSITAAEYGAILSENKIAGIVYEKGNDIKETNSFVFELLQSAGLRRTKAEFISCPGCGRTIFNLEKTTAEIKKEFAHLEDVKIAVMGCIVNGPGEMLDADYGYVGAGKNKITLYKGKAAVMKNIPEKEAIEALKALLKKNKDWKETNQ